MFKLKMSKLMRRSKIYYDVLIPLNACDHPDTFPVGYYATSFKSVVLDNFDKKMCRFKYLNKFITYISIFLEHLRVCHVLRMLNTYIEINEILSVW